MSVFVVIHNSGDYESGDEIRGIFATRALAEATVTLDDTGVYPPTLTSGERLWRRGHDANCCSVDEMAVATTLPEPFVLNPERPFMFEAAIVPRMWTYDAFTFLLDHQPAFVTERR